MKYCDNSDKDEDKSPNVIDVNNYYRNNTRSNCKMISRTSGAKKLPDFVLNSQKPSNKIEIWMFTFKYLLNDCTKVN